MKKILVAVGLIMATNSLMAQHIEKMTWYNDPKKWQISGKSLLMQVPPKNDYRSISHYGFTLDDAPFHYKTYGGNLRLS